MCEQNSIIVTYFTYLFNRIKLEAESVSFMEELNKIAATSGTNDSYYECFGFGLPWCCKPIVKLYMFRFNKHC